MRSLESSRHHDLDQVDPEHVSRETRETSWDDLKNVPFGGEPTPSKDEVLKRMDEVSKFGHSSQEKPAEKHEDEDLSGMSLSDISETF